MTATMLNLPIRPPVYNTVGELPSNANDGAVAVVLSVPPSLYLFDGSVWNLVAGGSGSDVSSITGTNNQIIASSSTGPVTLSFSNGISIGSYQASSPPTGGLIAPGKVGIGLPTITNAQLAVQPTVSTTLNRASGLRLGGGVFTATANSDVVGNLFITSTEYATGTFTGLAYRNAEIRNDGVSKSGTGTIDNAYGLYSTGFSSLATNQYSGYFLAPTGGTINHALYSDNLSIGYATTATPTNGAIISGNVGIGGTPTNKLEVFGNLYIGGGGTPSASQGLQIFGDAAHTGGYLFLGYDDSSNYGRIGAFEGSWQTLSLNSGGGTVVVGNTTAYSSHPFSVYSATNNRLVGFVKTDASEAVIELVRTGGTASSWATYIESGSTNWHLYSGNSGSTGNRLSVDSAGNMGINSAPSATVRFKVAGTLTNGSTSDITGLQVSPTMGSTSGTISQATGVLVVPTLTGNTATISNYSAYGSLGGSASGTVTNSFGMVANVCAFGTNRYAFYSPHAGFNTFNAGGTHVILVSGTAGLSTGTLWTNTSDVRIKENIQPVQSSSVLDLFENLQLKKWNYIPEYCADHDLDNSKEFYGYIADDVELLEPAAIKISNDIKITNGTRKSQFSVSQRNTEKKLMYEKSIQVKKEILDRKLEYEKENPSVLKSELDQMFSYEEPVEPIYEEEIETVELPGFDNLKNVDYHIILMKSFAAIGELSREIKLLKSEILLLKK